MTKWTKIFAVVLSMILAVTSLPLTAFATLLEDVTDAETDAVTSTPAESPSPLELIERRTENTKTFLLGDGSYYVAQYPSDVHYPDETGAMQEINVHLSESGSEVSSADARIKFAKKTNGSEKLFTLHQGKYKLTLSLLGANKKVEASITNHTEATAENVPQLEKMTTLTNLFSTVRYSEILANTDLEYRLEGANVKEYIHVKKRGVSYVYSFALSLNNLEAQLCASGEIELLDPNTDQTIFRIPAPMMWDAAGTVSEAVSVSLASHENGTYTLTLTADAAWMNDERRAYPITIDPPIYTGTETDTSVSVTDLGISSATPTTNTKSATQLALNANSRVYWRLNSLPSIPAGAYITSASLHMNTYASAQMAGYVSAYPVTSAWTDALTWESAMNSAQGTPGANFLDYQYVETQGMELGEWVLHPTSCDWNITSAAKTWYQSSSQNRGIVLMPTPNTTFSGTLYLRSSEYASAAMRPQFCVTYRDMKGMEDYWTFSTQNAGFAGSGAINHATGNLVFSIPTLTTTDALMPISPMLVYNSSLADREYASPVVSSAYTTAFTPRGFRLNISETLVKRSFVGEYGNVNRYIWTDGDGTEHYFSPVSPLSSCTTYTDEDGLMLTLEEGSTSCTITDSGKTVRTFSSMTAPSGAISAWFLSAIADRSGNKVYFTVDSTTKRPTKISLRPKGYTASTVQLQLEYNSDGRLYLVYNPTSKEAVVLLYSDEPLNYETVNTGGKYLRRVVRTHGGTVANYQSYYNDGTMTNIVIDATAEYYYDADAFLQTVSNQLSGYSLSYYCSGSAGTVYEVYESSGGTAGQRVHLTYGSTSTVVRTSGSDDVYGTADDLLTTYAYDAEGRTVSAYTTDRTHTQLYGASGGQYVGEENEKAKNQLKSSVQTVQSSSNHLINGGFEKGMSSWITVGSVSRVYETGGPDEWYVQMLLNASSSAASLSQNVTLAAGSYQFSVRITPHDATDCNVYLRAICTSDSTAPTVEKEIPITESEVGSEVFVSLPLEVEPSTAGGTQSYRIGVFVEGTVSQATYFRVDDAMLSRTVGAAPFDCLEMGHFERSIRTVESSWTVHETTDGSVSVTDSGIAAFGDAVRITSSVAETPSVSQTVSFASETRKNAWAVEGSYGNHPILFTLSGWGKGSAQSLGASSYFGMVVTLSYYAPGAQSVNSEEYFFEFDRGITDWQFMSYGFVSNPQMGLLKDVTVKLSYYGHPGEGYFDGVSLVVGEDSTEIYDYDLDGYLTSYQQGRSTVLYDYDEYGNVTTCVTSNGDWTEYTYDSLHRLTGEAYKKHDGWIKVQAGTYTLTPKYTKTYTYNQQGLPVSTAITDASEGATARIYSSTEYEQSNVHIYGVVTAETDSLGRTARYFYDSSTGRLLASIGYDKSGVTYTYDAIGNLLQALPADLTEREYEVQIGDDIYETRVEYGYEADEASASVAYTYDVANRLSTVTTESTTYTFTYDAFGNNASIQAGSSTLASYTYNANNGKLATMTYGNGLTVKYTYDALDRISEICYNAIGEDYETIFVPVYSYEYNAAGAVHTVTDHINDEVTLYEYDARGKLIRVTTYGASDFAIRSYTGMSYDEQGRLSSAYDTVDYRSATDVRSGHVHSYFQYDADDGNLVLASISTEAMEVLIWPTYDVFGRTAKKEYEMGSTSEYALFLEQTYDYKTSGSNESLLVYKLTSTVTSEAGDTVSSNFYTYEYDDAGNIISVRDKTAYQITYLYDDLGQLIRENNRPLGKSYVYTYDDAGNRTSVTTYAFAFGTLGTALSTETYNYSTDGWGDKLLTTSSGYYISYDGIGNPTSIETPDLEMWSLSWKGRQLQQIAVWEMSTGAQYTLSYTYNADGIRTSKTINGVEHEYTLRGSLIMSEKWTQNNIEHLLMYLYDETGAPIGLQYRNSSYAVSEYDLYFFEKNLQGDIVAIYNEDAVKICAYNYDAWGNFTVTLASGITSLDRTVAQTYNPFRYRGYYYDVETGWYYLQSRYYLSEWGRFLNADRCLYSHMLGFNLYAYCYNNPINSFDPTGESAAGVFGVWISSGWAPALAEPTFVGEILYVAGTVGLGVVAAVETLFLTDQIANAIEDAVDVAPEEKAPDSKSPESEDKKEEASPPKVDTDKKRNKDQRLRGKPGEVKEDGYKTTYIGESGKATKERHFTDHKFPKKHTNPHDHIISWDSNGNPHFSSPQNYWDGNIPIFP